MTPLEEALRAKRDSGCKLLVPYVTAGVRDDWVSIVESVIAAGADAVEIGIPFSDPVMDGPVIQKASQLALDRGTTPATITGEMRQMTTNIPLLFMTYYNIVFRTGVQRFASNAREAGVGGVIVPDLPLEESVDWRAACRSSGLANVLLAAPTSNDDRLKQLCDATEGFVYGVGLMGVTGERASLADSASQMGKRLKSVTDKPVLIGVGVSTPEQAREACAVSDGVIVGSALVRRILAGATPDQAADYVSEFRAAMDQAT